MKAHWMARPVLVACAVSSAIFLILFLIIFPVGDWWKLQRLGHVPEEVSRATREGENLWRIAEWTTWWGKPLDPEKFWKGRVIWNDSSALDAANRRGRAYPPIPEHVSNLNEFHIRSRPQKDLVPSRWGGGLDSGPVVPFHFTEAEDAYWNWFWRTKPKPPEILQREQMQATESMLGTRAFLIDQRTHQVEIRPISNLVLKKTEQEPGVPAEHTEQALFWVYAMKKRGEYTNEKKRLEKVANDLKESELKRFLSHQFINPEFIAEPLTDEQVKAANAWKIAYLQRLREEKVDDDSYIQAYIKAWNLSPAEVFPNDQKSNNPSIQ